MTKMSETRQQPNWDEAPEGATHYSCNDRHTPWRKVEAPDRAFWWDGQRWEPVHGFRMPLPAEYVPIHAAGPDIGPFSVSVDGERLAPLLPIPAPDDLQAPAWNGEGLPPVGTVCIVKPHNTLWGFSSTAGHERTVLAYHNEFVWLGQGSMALETTRIDKVDFLPLRTPEQIAAEQREQEIARMLSLCPCPGSPIARQLCETLYDAGVRLPGKQEGEQ